MGKGDPREKGQGIYHAKAGIEVGKHLLGQGTVPCRGPKGSPKGNINVPLKMVLTLECCHNRVLKFPESCR